MLGTKCIKTHRNVFLMIIVLFPMFYHFEGDKKRTNDSGSAVLI